MLLYCIFHAFHLPVFATGGKSIIHIIFCLVVLQVMTGIKNAFLYFIQCCFCRIISKQKHFGICIPNSRLYASALRSRFNPWLTLAGTNTIYFKRNNCVCCMIILRKSV